MQPYCRILVPLDLSQRARQEASDLIVLGSHRIEPARPGGGLGTLSHQIALLAPCDVLLVRPNSS